MAKSDLLKEAIADAKAVKETALANAKIALEEAFAPRIQSMLSAKLAEEEMEDDQMAAPEAPVDEHEVMYQDDESGEEMASDDDLDMSGMDDMADGGMDAESELDVSAEAEPEMEPEMDPMALAAGDENMYNEDLELEAIIRELEEDLNEDDHMDDEAEQDLTTEGEDGLEEDINIDEIIESILSEEDEDKKEMPTEGRGMVKDEDEDPNDEHSNPKEGRGDKKDEALEEELTEAYDTIESLRDTINEVNLLNAKLLYTNKLFRNFELDENQKMKVIENFDRAGNTREVKLVFSTLAESFHVPVKKRKKIVKEGIASKPSGTTAPSTKTKQIINEGNELANRWKKLAGLLD
jgi:hypothetical protein